MASTLGVTISETSLGGARTGGEPTIDIAVVGAFQKGPIDTPGAVTSLIEHEKAYGGLYYHSDSSGTQRAPAPIAVRGIFETLGSLTQAYGVTVRPMRVVGSGAVSAGGDAPTIHAGQYHRSYVLSTDPPNVVLCPGCVLHRGAAQAVVQHLTPEGVYVSHVGVKVTNELVTGNATVVYDGKAVGLVNIKSVTPSSDTNFLVATAKNQGGWGNTINIETTKWHTTIATTTGEELKDMLVTGGIALDSVSDIDVGDVARVSMGDIVAGGASPMGLESNFIVRNVDAANNKVLGTWCDQPYNMDKITLTGASHTNAYAAGENVTISGTWLPGHEKGVCSGVIMFTSGGLGGGIYVKYNNLSLTKEFGGKITNGSGAYEGGIAFASAVSRLTVGPAMYVAGVGAHRNKTYLKHGVNLTGNTSTVIEVSNSAGFVPGQTLFMHNPRLAAGATYKMVSPDKWCVAVVEAVNGDLLTIKPTRFPASPLQEHLFFDGVGSDGTVHCELISMEFDLNVYDGNSELVESHKFLSCESVNARDYILTRLGDSDASESDWIVISGVTEDVTPSCRMYNVPLCIDVDNRFDGGLRETASANMWHVSLGHQRHVAVGADGDYPTATNIKSGLDKLQQIRKDPVRLVLVPGESSEFSRVNLENCVRQVFESAEGIFVLDEDTPAEAQAFRANCTTTDRRIGLFYPYWLIADPDGVNKKIAIDPCGHLAGIATYVALTKGESHSILMQTTPGCLGYSVDINDYAGWAQKLRNVGINPMYFERGVGNVIGGSYTMVDDQDSVFGSWGNSMFLNILRGEIEDVTKPVIGSPLLTTRRTAKQEGVLMALDRLREKHLLKGNCDKFEISDEGNDSTTKANRQWILVFNINGVSFIEEVKCYVNMTTNSVFFA